MGNSYLPNSDTEFNIWLQNFVAALEEFTAQLGISTAEYEALSAAAVSFSVALTDMETKRQIAQAATQTKDERRAEVVELVREIVRRIQVNPNMTDTMRARLRITIPDPTRSRHTPIAPSNLVAKLGPDGSIHLEWNANGNQRGQYLIEAQIGDNPIWQLIDIVPRLTYIHQGIALGQRISYRVRARANDETSGPSNIATVGM